MEKDAVKQIWDSITWELKEQGGVAAGLLPAVQALLGPLDLKHVFALVLTEKGIVNLSCCGPRGLLELEVHARALTELFMEAAPSKVRLKIVSWDEALEVKHQVYGRTYVNADGKVLSRIVATNGALVLKDKLPDGKHDLMLLPSDDTKGHAYRDGNIIESADGFIDNVVTLFTRAKLQ